jgi:putative transposase
LDLEFSRRLFKKAEGMKKSRFSKDEIIGSLKQGESGVKTADLCRDLGISTATFYGWKQKSGGMDLPD